MSTSSSREWQSQKIGELTAFVGMHSGSSEPASSVLVLLPGVGGNEQDFARLGDMMAPTSVIVSLRASGVVHTFADAESSLKTLNGSLNQIRTRFAVPTKRIYLFGFGQGAILTLGLALTGDESYGGYIVCSGRTLPEFAAAALKQRPPHFSERPILVSHGLDDEKIPYLLAEKTCDILRELGAKFQLHTSASPHTVPQELVTEAKAWIAAKLPATF